MKLRGVWPDPAQRLRPGDKVLFRVKFDSTLAGPDLGHVTLVIQDDRGRNLKKGGPQSRMTVARGTEMLELRDEGTITSDARWVNVFVTLFHDGATDSAAAKMIRFEVVR